MKWKELYGERTLLAIRTDVRHPFSVDAGGVALYLDDFTVFVFEDPCDDYRSMAAEPLIANTPLYNFGCSPEYLRIPVRVSTMADCDGADGIQLVDRRNGKVILRLGTDNTDDYYPYFVCDWRPQNIAENAD